MTHGFRTRGFRAHGSMAHAAEATDPGLCSYFVLDTLFHLGYTRAHPGPTGGALARRRKSGAGSGPAAGLASLLAGGPWQPCAGPSPPKSTACEAPSGSSHSIIHSEPGCPSHHPRSHLRLGASGSGPTGAGSLTSD